MPEENTSTTVQNRITNIYRNSNHLRGLPKLLSTFRSMWFWLMAASEVVPEVSPTASRRGELGYGHAARHRVYLRSL